MLHDDVIARGKRKFKRIRVVAPAYAGSELKIDRSSPAQIRNVGEAGMYIETDLNLSERTTIYIWLINDQVKIQGKAFAGQVKWKESLDICGSYAFGYGIELITKK